MVDLSVKMRIFGFGLKWLGATLDSTDALRAKEMCTSSIFILMNFAPCRRTQVEGSGFPWAVQSHPGFAMTGS